MMVVLVCLVGLSMLVAGGSKENQGTGKDVIDINLWYAPTVTEAGPPPKDWVALDIIRERLGINLQLTALPSNESDQDIKINAAAAANTLPDLFVVRREPFMKLINQGLLAPVDDLYALMPLRTERMYDTASINYTTVDGHSYGFASSPGVIQKNEGVLIRKDWLDRLGLEIPRTTDEFMNVMKSFTYQDPDGNGKNDTWGYGAFIEINTYEEGLGRRFDPWFGAFGVPGTWNLTKDSPGLNLRKPEYYDAMVFIKSMITEGVIDPNWMAYKKDDFRAAWKQGKFGIMREQNAAYASESNYAPFDKNFPDGEWIVIDPPAGPEGHKSVGVYTSAYRIMAISQNAAKAGKSEAIARLLEWMMTDEGYYLLGWGQEGINYVFDKDGVPGVEGLADESKGFSKPEMQPLTQLRSMVFYLSDVELISRYPTYTAQVSGKTMSALTTLRDMQSRAWTPNIGADALPTPNPDLKRFYEQGVAEFLTGRRVLTPENWKKFVTDFDALGGIEWENKGIEAAREGNYLY